MSRRDKGIKVGHIGTFVLITLSSIVALAISSSLVKNYNDNGYPVFHYNAYRDRIRILLVASVWMTFFGLVLSIGFHTLGEHVAFGILAHLIPVTIGFILFLVGASSLTALTNAITCGSGEGAFDRCNIVKGLVIISWIDTIFIFIAFVFLIILAFKARGGYGVHRSTLYVD